MSKVNFVLLFVFVVKCRDENTGNKYDIEVSKRPGMDEFLTWLKEENFRVSLYTAGQKYYTEAILGTTQYI